LAHSFCPVGIATPIFFFGPQLPWHSFVFSILDSYSGMPKFR
jgi:hypothetical protein